MTLVVIAGLAFVLGFMWLLVEWLLRYAAGHGVKIVSWAGPWPRSTGQQREVSDRLDRSQKRELHALRTVRPIPIVAVVAGVVLIVTAAV